MKRLLACTYYGAVRVTLADRSRDHKNEEMHPYGVHLLNYLLVAYRNFRSDSAKVVFLVLGYKGNGLYSVCLDVGDISPCQLLQT